MLFEESKFGLESLKALAISQGLSVRLEKESKDNVRYIRCCCSKQTE